MEFDKEEIKIIEDALTSLMGAKADRLMISTLISTMLSPNKSIAEAEIAKMKRELENDPRDKVLKESITLLRSKFIIYKREKEEAKVNNQVKDILE